MTGTPYEHTTISIPSSKRLAARLLDVLIRAGLILAMVMLCYQVFSPFLNLMVWALILAVTSVSPPSVAGREIGGRQGLAATLLVLLGVVVVVVPTAVLMSSLGDSVQRLDQRRAEQHPRRCPRREKASRTGRSSARRCTRFWTKAHTDLPALVQSMQPKIGNLAKAALGFVASIGGGLLRFLASLIIAGIMMAFGESGARGIRSIFERIVDGRGGEFADCPRRPFARSPRA